MPPKSDLNAAGTESAEFPILCDSCLGPNPYLRMSRQNLAAECKVCTRPFTVFRWMPGAGMRYKKTEICQTCAKAKNVCQTCLLDLTYGLPTQVRDTLLGGGQSAPTSAINREYYAQNVQEKQELGMVGTTTHSRPDRQSQDVLTKLARSRADPYYRKNKPHICSFFAKGNCNRGDTCPYRHEKAPEQSDLSKQNIKDRYHGTNDPVARKILNSHAATVGLAPPEDESISSLFLTNLPESATEDSIRTFYAMSKNIPSDSIRSVVLVSKTRVAFVNFTDRKSAELAAQRSTSTFEIDGQAVKVQWGRSRPKKAAT